MASRRFTAVTPGSVLHRSTDAASVPATCVTALAEPARVGFTCSRITSPSFWRRLPSSTTGSVSATAVPAYPPSLNARGPPRASRPPPRRSTNSAIIRS